MLLSGLVHVSPFWLLPSEPLRPRRCRIPAPTWSARLMFLPSSPATRTACLSVQALRDAACKGCRHSLALMRAAQWLVQAVSHELAQASTIFGQGDGVWRTMK